MMKNLLKFPVAGMMKGLAITFSYLFLSGAMIVVNAQTDTIFECVVNDVTTVGGTDGSATINVSGLDGPLSYQWWTAPPQYSSTASNLSKGVYYVEITDAHGRVDTSFCAVGEPFVECSGLRTQTMGGWGAKARGDNPGTYRDANFSGAFPGGLVVGCPNGGYTLTLTSAQAVEDFLPAGGSSSALDMNYTDPDKRDLKNNLAGQVVALTLSVGFDNYDPYFGSGDLDLDDQLVGYGSLTGMEVGDLLYEANKVLGGCSSSYDLGDLHDAVTNVNENFVDGKRTGDFLNCQLADGSIGDFVWNDVDGDGAQELGEAGIAGVSLTLTYAGADGTFGTSDDETWTTTTNSIGVYDFGQLDAGEYMVEVDESTVPTDMVLTGGTDPHYVTLSDDQDYNLADFGYQLRASTISGSVYIDDNGTGLQESTEGGLDGVRVYLTWAGGDDVIGTSDDETFSTLTDADGNYSFSELPAGSYEIDYDDGTIPDGYVLNDGSDPYTFTLADNEDATADSAGYWPRTSTITSSIYNDLDGDGIRDAGEAGLEGVTVTLEYYGPDGIEGTADDEVFTTTTDVNGQFTFDDLPAGEYDLTIDESTLPGLYLPGTSGSTDHITLGTNETSSPGDGFDYLEATADVGLEVLAYPPLIFSQFQQVTYTYEVDNTGDVDLSNVQLSDVDCPPTYVSGDVNQDGLLNPDETWIYECSRYWTWGSGTLAVTTSPTVSADDPQGGSVTDNDNTSILTFGINMDVQTNVATAAPGDTITVRLVSRVIGAQTLGADQDFQFADLQVSCNLIENGQYWTGGPSSTYWADPSGDYVNSTLGADALALDYDDYVDFDNGLGSPDWVHEFSYVIPSDQAEDLVISASDRAKGYFYNGSTWATFDSLCVGSDQEVISIASQTSSITEENFNDLFKDYSQDDNAEISFGEGIAVYPTLFSEHLTVEAGAGWEGSRLDVVDIYGNVVHSVENIGHGKQLELSDLPNGKYWVRVVNNKEVTSSSVVKIK